MFRLRARQQRLVPAAARLALTSTRSFRTIEQYGGKKMFDKILIANRGEIAVRVMTTARQMGIKTVAVYSDADASSKHANFADEAYNIGPPPSAQSYLQAERIVEVCKKTGAQAVHPGYGFLSENAHFSRALADNNIKFIGPGEYSIKAMGDKIESKLLANKANVNTIPGFVGILDTAQDAVKVAEEIGYPVMVKASAGGGGKGMRIAYNAKEVIEAFRLSQQEAISSFGDGRLFVEKFVEEPRHIEFQILCDSHGNGVYLAERECSIQRRNQKVLEEAPSVVLDPETRRAMGEQALQMARAVNYESAGTVEFLVDKNKNFYFLEMNTRLQVEHPITEMVTQQDLVAHMIAIAAGHPLCIRQEDLTITGHALEARVYAEDPFRNYLPSIGRLRRYTEPTGPGIRCDSGILEGSEISMYYDPMVSKTVAYGKDRTEALERMRHALDSYVIEGITHNIPLLRAVIDHQRFIDGRITTKFLQEEYAEGFFGSPLTDEDVHRLAATMWMVRWQEDALSAFPTTLAPFGMVFQVGDHSLFVEGSLASDNKTYTVRVFKGQGGEEVGVVEFESEWVPGQRVVAFRQGDDLQHLQVVERTVSGYKALFKGTQRVVTLQTPKEHELFVHMPKVEKLDTSKLLVAPMPGLVKSVSVQAGDTVVVGQELVVMEAMKMQNILRSPKDGKVKTVKVGEGQKVAVDAVLLEFED